METSNKNEKNKHDNSGYKTIKINLEGQTRTIHDSKLDSKKSDPWKSDVSIEDNVELQIPTKPKDAEVRRSGLRNKTRVSYSELELDINQEQISLYKYHLNLTLQNMLVDISIVISDHIG